jgi:hypothetical protein
MRTKLIDKFKGKWSRALAIIVIIHIKKHSKNIIDIIKISRMIFIRMALIRMKLILSGQWMGVCE